MGSRWTMRVRVARTQNSRFSCVHMQFSQDFCRADTCLNGQVDRDTGRQIA
jgi:hypothetical protein